jgi:hypothetical protein
MATETIHTTPANGWATFSGPAVREALNIWAELACRSEDGAATASAPYENIDAIRDWADDVLDAARAAEGNWSPAADSAFWKTEEEREIILPYPNSSVFHKGERISFVTDAALVLAWRGSWTPNRWVLIEIWGSHGNPNAVSMARLSWDTGTGEPSAFLGGVFGTSIAEHAMDWSSPDDGAAAGTP